jgi:hypothetical protein
MIRALAVLSLLGLAQYAPSNPYGKVNATFYPTVTWKGAPKPQGSVYIFRAGPPDRPAKEVGWIHVETLLGYALGVQQLEGTAAEYGCDALGKLDSHLGVGGVPGGGNFLGGSGGLSIVEEIDASCYIFTPR